MTTTTRLQASILGVDGKVDSNVLGPNTFSNSLIDYFKDVDTIAVYPAINNTLLWDGTNWVPGSVVVSSSENANIANIVLGQVNAAISSGFANVAAFANIANLANMVVTISNFTTANLREASSNLYFTNARVDARFLTTSVNNLVDVDTTGVTAGQVLRWDGTNWVANTFVATTSAFSSTTTFANLAALANVALIANSALFANVANIANMVATISNFTTSNLREGSNLYFTNARVDARIETTSINLLSDVNTVGVASGDYLRWNGVFWYPSPIVVSAQSADSANVANIANLVASIRNFSTSNLVEGANLYYTNARVASNVALLSVNVLADVDTTGAVSGQALIWNGSNWVPQTIAAPTANTASFANVANLANLVLSISNFTTSNLVEGSNLYYTNARVFANISLMSINAFADVNLFDLDVNDILVWDGSNFIPQSVAALSNISVNADFSNRANLANMVATISNFTTDYLGEGTNLYYTNARVVSNISQLSINVFADVDTTGVTTDQVLKWNGSNWVPFSLSSGAAGSSAFANVANVANLVLSLAGLTTSNLSEGSNLYFTNARVDARIATTSINALIDVNTTGASLNQVLAWDGSNWVPATAAAGTAENAQFANVSNLANLVLSLENLSINSLADVYITNLDVNDILAWDGYAWVPVSAASLSNISVNADFSNRANLANMVVTINNFTTDNLREGTSNLYHTNVRSRRSISAGDQTIIYDEGLGTIKANLAYFANANITVTAVSFVDNKKFTFTGSAGQTDFNGIDDNGETLTISRPSKVNVFLNGVLMSNVIDYTATQSGVVFNTGVRNSDIVTIIDGVLVGYGVDAANVVNINGYSGVVLLSTTDIPEGTKLYYTNSRVFSNVSLMSINVLADVNTTGVGVNQALIWNGAEWVPGSPIVGSTGLANTSLFANVANIANLVASISNFTTDNLIEGSNLYFSNARSILGSIPAVTQLTVTASGTSGFLFDQYTGEDPTIYVTAGETVAFELNQGSSHPFAIRVSNGGSNYNTGLVHIASDGTTTTGSFAQAKTNGKLFWKVPYDLTGSTYVYQCTVHSGMVGNIVIGMPTGSISSTVNSLTTSNISEGSNLYYTNARVDARIATTSINALFDVDISGISTNQVLSWNGSVFVPASVSTSASATLANSALFANVANLANMVVSISNFTTTDLAEGTNLYYTNSRARTAISAGSGISYDSSTGVVSQSGNINVTSLTANNIVVTGNLFVLGNIVGFSANNLIVNDGLIQLGNANPSDAIDLGFVAHYNSSGQKHAGLFRDASDGDFKFFDNYPVEPSLPTIDTSNVSFRYANVRAGNIIVDGRFIGNGSSLTGILTSLSSIATYNGNALISNLTVSSNATIIGNLGVIGNAVVQGNVQANFFVGNGAFLTGITSGGASLTGMATYNGNILAAQVVVTGNVTANNFNLAGAGSIQNTSDNNTVIRAGVYDYTFSDSGRATLGNILVSNIYSLSGGDFISATSENNVTIKTGLFSSFFLENGNVVLPNLVVTGGIYGSAVGLTGVPSAALSGMATYNGNILASNITAFTVTANSFIGNIASSTGAVLLRSSTDNNTIIQAGVFQSIFRDNGNVNLPNVVASGKFFGDGSGLTNVTASLSGMATYGGNILAANINADTIRSSNLTVGNVISLNGCVIVRLTTDTNTYIQTGPYTSVFRDNGNVNLPNVIASGKFFGDGSGLTNVTASLSGLATYNGNILASNITAVNITTSNLYVSNIITPTGGTALSITATNNTTIRSGAYTSQFLDNGNVTLPNLTVAGNVVITGRFVGDGSGITNLSTSATLAGMATYNGNILAAQVVVTGNVTASNLNLGGAALQNSNDNNTIIRAGFYDYIFSDTGVATLGNIKVSNIQTMLGAVAIATSTDNNTLIKAGVFTSTFNDVGNVLVPNLVVAGKIYGDGSGITNIPAGASLGGLPSYAGNILAANIVSTTIRTSNLTVGNVISLNGCVIVRLATDSNTYLQTGPFTSSFLDNGNVLLPNLFVAQNLIVGGNISVGNVNTFSVTSDNNTIIRAGVYDYTFTDTGLALLNNIRVSNIQGLTGATVVGISTDNNTIIQAGTFQSVFRDNGNVNLPNVVASGKFFGDGSGLTNLNVSATLTGMATYNGNILAANITATTITASNIFVSNIITPTGGTALSVTATNNTTIRSGGYVSQFLDNGNVNLPNLNVTGNVFAGRFVGDGSGLTGVTSAVSLSGMATYNGNILAAQVVVTGNITASNLNLGGAAALQNNNDNNTIIRAGVFDYTFSDQGYASLGNVRLSNIQTMLGATLISTASDNNTTIRAGVFTSTFSDTGNVSLPNLVVRSNIMVGVNASTVIESTNDNNTTIRAGSQNYTFADTGIASFPQLQLTGNLLSSTGGTLVQQSVTNNTTIRAGACNYVFTDVGFVGINTTTPTEHVHVVGNILVSQGIYLTSDGNTNPYISNFSSGSGTRTTYIGNQSITTSSDVRLKANISNTSITALNVVSNLRVVDFNWNDPSDTSYNNKNARGTWTGLIAQEVIDQVPYVVNAVRDQETLQPIHNSDSYWTLEYDKLVPILIKAIQELKKEFDEYKASHP